MDDEENEPTVPDEEYRAVIRWRYEQARLYGLTRIEARLFAESDADIGALRHLAELGCAPATAAKILL